MLQINDIRKTYRTGELVQQALAGVSLVLRDSEFVAILGPSGSGKTTLLNIIGGLDRYDSGELIINGVSTKKYRDRDWDAYRNHSVGFVFQSYNLIPHQTILSNVELALTISGVGRAERRRRAAQALERVGLGDQLHKRPNQLSGGQMQRVAIARALVNDPDILLADEPTGALDSETSLQVMDLLREVAGDRLVVMVTHNAELAEQYATRTVRLSDGKIVSDSDPCDAGQEAETPPVHKRLGKASMSFLTAIALSFNNLRTKLGRTLLTAFAGSIGIIGIALILSMSNGVDHYIQSVEEETLKTYPLQITDASLDLTSLYSFSMPGRSSGSATEVTEMPTVTELLSGMSSNDLAAFKAYLEGDGSRIRDYVQAIEYDYGVKPQIFRLENGALRQVNPDRSFAALGFSAPDNVSSLFDAMTSTDSFHQMPADENLFRSQYELKAGRWPETPYECVVVLTPQSKIPDLALYAMGLKDPAELDAMVQAFASGETVEAADTEQHYRYEELLGIEFRLVNSADYYEYDADYQLWKDRSADESFLRQLAERGTPMTTVGVVQPAKDVVSGALTVGINYPASLSKELIAYAASSGIVRAQRETPGINVFTGQPFGEKADPAAIPMDSMFTVDQDAIDELFALDPESLELDPSAFDLSGLDLSQLQLDPGAFHVTAPTLTQADMAKLLSGVKLQLTGEQLGSLFTTLAAGWQDYAKNDPSTDYSRLGESFRSFLQSEAAREVLQQTVSSMLAEAGANAITEEQLLSVVEAVMAGYPAYLEAMGLTLADSNPALLSAYLQSDVARAVLAQSADSLRAQLLSALPDTGDLSAMAAALYAAYEQYAAENALPDPGKLQDSFAAYLATDEAQALLMQTVSDAVDTGELEQRAAELFSGYAATTAKQISAAMSQALGTLQRQLSRTVEQNMQKMTEQLSENLRAAFDVDPAAFAQAISMQMDMTELRDLITALLSGADTSYAGNLRKLGFAQEDEPSSIIIYPKDFEGKKQCKRLIDDYNDMQTTAGNDDKVIKYTDMVDALTSAVSRIVKAISIVLIAFVAVSLIVSSIMIGIITYISVLERTKEIGILRAIGASKRNVSNVFNAETFLVGLFSGLMGIAITLLLILPINLTLRRLTGMDNVKAILPVGGAAILVLLSMALTLIAGLIPSRKAAKKDPVAALRTE